jgi:hypothetical protein
MDCQTWLKYKQRMWNLSIQESLTNKNFYLKVKIKTFIKNIYYSKIYFTLFIS